MTTFILVFALQLPMIKKIVLILVLSTKEREREWGKTENSRKFKGTDTLCICRNFIMARRKKK